MNMIFDCICVRPEDGVYVPIKEGEELPDNAMYVVNAADFDEMEADADAQRAENAALKRIARERANAIRNIPCKKQHDGYIVLLSQQIFTFEKKGRYDEEEEKVLQETWKTTIQTPHDAGITFNYARLFIFEDFASKHILQDLGIFTFARAIQESFDEEKCKCIEKNPVFKWIFRANFKSGFWEIDIFTPAPPFVPHERRPPAKESSPLKNKNGKGKQD